LGKKKIIDLLDNNHSVNRNGKLCPIHSLFVAYVNESVGELKTYLNEMNSKLDDINEYVSKQEGIRETEREYNSRTFKILLLILSSLIGVLSSLIVHLVKP